MTDQYDSFLQKQIEMSLALMKYKKKLRDTGVDFHEGAHDAFYVSGKDALRALKVWNNTFPNYGKIEIAKKKKKGKKK